jgi:hypothetical protein
MFPSAVFLSANTARAASGEAPSTPSAIPQHHLVSVRLGTYFGGV